ncbi:MAG TPA: adenylate/guanylate cyclase domain-containing protein [Mariprofundaceae bacterium]|nr:adenylate/guanylate cyclase domain-containing protein [Mariprofundaceae bacterium]
MSKVVVKTGSGEHTYTLGDETTIGRHPRSAVCLSDPMVSKRHAVIRRVKDGFEFQDLGSSNGSFYDGVRVNHLKLKDGDTINLGKTSLVFQAMTEEERLATMVKISQLHTAGSVRDRIAVEAAQEFLPERDVSDISVLRDDYEKLRLGHDLLRSIGLERDLHSVLDKVTEHVFQIFPADRCVVMLVDDATGELVPRSVRTRTGDDLQVQVAGSILREVQETEAAVLISDSSADARFAEASSVIMQGIQSAMCAPLMHDGTFLGVIHLDSIRSLLTFTRKDLQLFTGIARHVAMVVANAKLLKQVEHEAHTKAQFERLLSPSVVEQVMSGKVNLEKGGELRDVTILFADIRGFTSMSHRSSPTDIVAMLNRYFEMVVDIVFRHEGTVDKYIGDEIMVLFGAPVDLPNPADHAISCALEIQGALKLFNDQRKRDGEEPIRVGIGINSGEVVVGSIGSSQTMQYTCIGDAVNVAARLVSVAEPGQVIISDSTLKRLKGKAKYEVLPPVKLKGIEGNLEAYSVKELLNDTWP